MIDDGMKRYGIYLVLGIFCCFAFTSSNVQSKLTDGLVLALSFEEGKGNSAADSGVSCRIFKRRRASRYGWTDASVCTLFKSQKTTVGKFIESVSSQVVP